MPSGGPVYQPTTASCEQQNQWTYPGGFVIQNGPFARVKCVQWAALILGLIGVAAGLIMIVEGCVDYSDTRQHDEEVGRTTALEEKNNQTDIVVIVIGVLLLLLGIALLGFYTAVTFRRRGWPCFLTKEQRMARALRSPQSVNGQGMNPSTDLLVAAQYAPVSEIAYQPPALSEEEETRKLMGSDNKDCILKESNSVITLNQDRFEPEDSPAPRRLRMYPNPEHPQQVPTHLSHSPNLGRLTSTPTPPITAEDSPNEPIKKQNSWKAAIMRKASVRSRKAPLAGGEEITPSLRSSWSSLYFNGDPTDSEYDDRSSYGSESV